MEPEVQNVAIRQKKKNIVFITLAAFILLMLVTAAAFTYMTLQNDRVYKGVRIGSLDASGMSIQ